MIILGTNSIKDTGYDVANSCRFNDNAYMSQTWGSSGNRRTWTLSMWIKYSGLNNCRIFSIGDDASNTILDFFFTSGDLRVQDTQSGSETLEFRTDQVFKDPSAWSHLVFACDTTQGTEGNRFKIYHNGTQITSFSTETYPTQNLETLMNHTTGAATIGARAVTQSGTEFDGYMAEVVVLDGTAASPTSFGEFDEDSGIWKPINVSGLTFGTNGFYLDFEDSSALGNDANGGTDFTVANLTAIDQSTDTCTNNFATLNPLDNYYAASTFSEGNCKIVTHSGNMSYNTGTIAVSTGKWYVEAKVIDNADSNYHHLGITETPTTATSNWIGLSATHYGLTGYDGKIWRNNSGTAYGVSTTTGDIVGMYIDLDNNKLYFAKNGTLMNSGTGHSITAAASTANGYYLIAYGDWENLSTATWEVNFGNPTYTGTDQTDANGYGSFEYNPSSGTFDSASKDFLAICTKNLAEYG
jgi:hypothetical protein